MVTWNCLFLSKTFCGYARPPGWSNNRTLEVDDDSSQEPGNVFYHWYITVEVWNHMHHQALGLGLALNSGMQVNVD